MTWQWTGFTYWMSVRGADCYQAYIVITDFQGRYRLVIGLDLQSKAVKYVYYTSFCTGVL